MHKSLISLGLTALLVAGLSLDASADGNRRGKNWDRADHHGSLNRRNQQLRHWRSNRNRQWRNNSFFVSPRYRNQFNWRNSRHWNNRSNWRSNRNWGWPLYPLGGVAIGSAITYGLMHDHGDHRQCDHALDGGNEISGCYRIERLPDGREQRVELPLSACR
ncbi:MAG: hypothetical protein AB8B57_13470 [Congregibacter sp.]